MLITLIGNIYNYFFSNDKQIECIREKSIRNSLEIGDYDKDLVDKIVNLKKPKPTQHQFK